MTLKLGFKTRSPTQIKTFDQLSDYIFNLNLYKICSEFVPDYL